MSPSCWQVPCPLCGSGVAGFCVTREGHRLRPGASHKVRWAALREAPRASDVGSLRRVGAPDAGDQAGAVNGDPPVTGPSAPDPTVETVARRGYWVSWWTVGNGPWEIHTPWWITGERFSDDAVSVCAAVMATDADEARAAIRDAYDEPPAALEFRFVDDQPEGWNPLTDLSDRFPIEPWMVWPPEGATR